MKWIVRISSVVLVSIIFAFFLSQIPFVHQQISQSMPGTHSSVFRHHKEIVLKESNIVDVMQQISISLRIHKIEISPTMLTVDLVLAGRNIEQSHVFADLYELTHYIFEHTENISQIFVRVLEADAEKQKSPQLLVAVGAKKNQYTSIANHSKMTNVSKEQYVRSHYRLIETSRWNDLRFQ